MPIEPSFPSTRLSLDPRARLGRRAGRRFLFEWTALGCLGVAVTLFGALGHFTARIDHLVYDRFLSARAQPALADIVVIEIDNASIEQLGRWPWPRSVHARLLEQLAKAKPAAVIYDVLFTEDNADDAQLAQAIARSPTYLPVLLNPLDNTGHRGTVEPDPLLAQAAAGLGHINLEVDSDGIVRSVALFEGDPHSRWPQLMVPVARAVASGRMKLAGDAASRRLPGSPARTETTEGEARFLIPFSLNVQSYPKLSFASVLAGEVPADQLRGRIVLIGASAAGLYDRFATPVSGELGPLPGVIIHASVLDALLTGHAIDPAAPWLLFGVSLVPLAVLLGGFLVLSPRRSLLLTASLCVLVVAGSAALLYDARYWMSPVPAIIGMIVVYPIWNWRRLEMTMTYLRTELQRLADEPHLLPETQQRQREFGGDVLEQQMALMAKASQRVQDMKRFVWDSLDSMPEPMLVSDVHGAVLIANHAAKSHFARLGAALTEGRPMQEVLGGLTLVKTIDRGTQADAELNLLARTHWPALLDPTRREFAALMAQGIEVRDASQRDHLLRYAVCTNAQGETTGWIAGLVDVSALHAAERQREDALWLLSHDMRSPQASILALVEIERARGDAGHAQGLLERIERYAQRALTLADDFVQLARAESQTYALEPVSLSELALDASDEVWPQAQAKQIHLVTETDGDDGHWICADRSLITRALVNVLNNAVKYSPPGSRICCRVATGALGVSGASSASSASSASGAVHAAPKRVSCTIQDEGYGIPLEQQAGLFERFQRFHEAERPEVSGVGLGMAFVKTVVTRHGGDVYVVSAPGEGTAVTLFLPALDDKAPVAAGALV